MTVFLHYVTSIYLYFTPKNSVHDPTLAEGTCRETRREREENRRERKTEGSVYV